MSIVYKQQVVRDLAWVMASPSLLASGDHPFKGGKVDDAWCQAQLAAQRAWLDALERNPAPLLAWLAERESPLLGRYFESLVSFWLAHLPDWQCVAENLVVGDRVRHLGEFDLLLRHQQQLFHWELSVKFYLQYGDQFLGPNPKDSLARKFGRVFNHQLPLSQLPPAKQLLIQRFGSDQVGAQAFIKGYLFYPVTGGELPSAASGIAQNHLRGWWLRITELAQWLATRAADHRWCVLEKLQWLAPAQRSCAEGLLSGHELLEQLQDYYVDHYRAPLVVELIEGEHGWQELSRGFVVSEGWPQR